MLSVLFVGAEAFSIGQTALKNEIRRSNKVTSLSAVDPGLTDSVVNAWTSYNQALESDPLLTKSVTAGVILGAADLAGQALENSKSEEDKDIDIARFARFAFFGFILQAPWNHFYYLLLDGALPPTEDPFTATTGIKVVIDQFVQAPIFTVLIFYFLGILEGKSTDDVKDQLDRDYKGKWQKFHRCNLIDSWIFYLNAYSQFPITQTQILCLRIGSYGSQRQW